MFSNWRYQLGGYITAALLVVAMLMVAASIIGRVLMAVGAI